MEIDAMLNALLSMGIPGIVFVTIIILARTYAPKVIEAYAKAKETEHQALADRQREEKEQSEKIIEVATTSSIVVKTASDALEENIKVNQEVISALESMETALINLNTTFKDQEKDAEEIKIDIKKVLENTRKERK